MTEQEPRSAIIAAELARQSPAEENQWREQFIEEWIAAAAKQHIQESELPFEMRGMPMDQWMGILKKQTGEQFAEGLRFTLPGAIDIMKEPEDPYAASVMPSCKRMQSIPGIDVPEELLRQQGPVFGKRIPIPQGVEINIHELVKNSPIRAMMQAWIDGLMGGTEDELTQRREALTDEWLRSIYNPPPRTFKDAVDRAKLLIHEGYGPDWALLGFYPVRIGSTIEEGPDIGHMTVSFDFYRSSEAGTMDSSITSDRN